MLWLGKVYLICSVLISLYLTFKWEYFEENTFSHLLLRLLLRSLGYIILFLHCSTNLDVCFALGIAAWMRNYILQLSDRLFTSNKTGKIELVENRFINHIPLSEFHRQGIDKAKKELEKLKEYLLTPEGQAKYQKIQKR